LQQASKNGWIFEGVGMGKLKRKNCAEGISCWSATASQAFPDLKIEHIAVLVFYPTLKILGI
jgi:antibiotic biosynthesis monooxygenase (ABM) superfamily enzyme